VSSISYAENIASGTADALVVSATDAAAPLPNAELVFSGDYARLGSHLQISHPDHGTLRIVDYFAQDNLPNLLTSNGAMLDGDTVARLAGPVAPGQYAQAGAGLAAAPIGNVQTASGEVTVQRTDGTTVTLSTGDPVFQGDVVQTGGDSSLIIVFVDETLFSLSADARMVLDELVYSPNGSDNSMVMNLVQGSFVFVTGQVAPTGDMRVETPTATMGIRGTTPIVQIDAVNGATRFGLSVDPDGPLGSYQLFDRLTGQLLGTVNTTDSTTLVESIGSAPVVTPKSPGDISVEQNQLQQAFNAYRDAGLGQSNNNDGDGSQDDEPNQTDAGPPIEPINPDLSPLGGENGGLDGDGSETQNNESGLELLAPSAPTPSDSFQSPGGSSTPPQNNNNNDDDQSSLPPSDDLALFLPPTTPITFEDQSFDITGLTIEVPGDGISTVTIIARSTITLAQVDGLTFTLGDGFNDEQMTFTGSEADINAALSGLTYTPSPNAEEGGLNITVSFGQSSIEADLPIAIEPVPDPPVAFDIAVKVTESGTTLPTPFLGEDPDPGDTLALESFTEPALGELTVFNDGTFSFDTNGEFESLSAGATQDITFEYFVVDSTGLVSLEPAIVTITVTGENDDPDLEVSQPIGFVEAEDASNQQLFETGTIAISDVDERDTHTVSFVSNGTPVWNGGDLGSVAPGLAATLLAGFSLDLQNGNGWRFDTTADLDFLSPGETITFSYTITVDDNAGGVDSEVIEFVITGTEDAPMIAGDLSGTVQEDGDLVASGLLTATDADASDLPVLFTEQTIQDDLGPFSIDQEGNWQFQLDNAAAQDLGGDDVVVKTFGVEAQAADGTSANQDVTITINGSNEPPVANNFALVANVTNNSGFENGYAEWNEIDGPVPNGLPLSNYENAFTIDTSETLITGDSYVADVSFSGRLDQDNVGGTVFGPSLESQAFTAFAGDIVTFEYRTFAGTTVLNGDAAIVSAELINQQTNEITEVFYEYTPFEQAGTTKNLTVDIIDPGEYKIVFKIGSEDTTEGGVVGARIAIGTAGIIRKGVLEGDSQTFDQLQFLENATDPEGDSLDLFSVAPTSALGATVTLVNGNVVFDSSTGNYGFLLPGQTETDSFQYTITDGNGGFSTAWASVGVVGTGGFLDGDPLTYDPVADQSGSSTPTAPADLPITGTAVDLPTPLPGSLVTYAFPTISPAATALTNYTPAQQAAAIAALSLWAEVSNLTIAEAGVDDIATVRFLNSADVSFAEYFGADGIGTVATNPEFAETLTPDAGSYGFHALLHETGHAIGLEQAAGGVTQAQSVISYVTPDTSGVSWWNESGTWIYAQTPMIEDIAAVQAAYGVNTETRAGDTVYGFNSTEKGSTYDFAANADPVLTIYDAAGVDTLDFSGWDTPSIINLNPGTYSSVNGMTNNIGVALGTSIENAIGGAGSDLLIGNDLANTLDGGAGFDILIGGAGADTFALSHDDYADIIVDFSSGEDRLDLSSLLDANFTPAESSDYIQVERDGDDAIVSVDKDGSGNGSDFRDVAVLQSVEAGGIIDFVFSNNGVQSTDNVVA